MVAGLIGYRVEIIFFFLTFPFFLFLLKKKGTEQDLVVKLVYLCPDIHVFYDFSGRKDGGDTG